MPHSSGQESHEEFPLKMQNWSILFSHPDTVALFGEGPFAVCVTVIYSTVRIARHSVTGNVVKWLKECESASFDMSTWTVLSFLPKKSGNFRGLILAAAGRWDVSPGLL